MRCNRLLTILVTVLVAINIGLVYLHFFEQLHHRHEDDSMHSWLDQSLNLTDQQEVQHVQIRKAYFNKLRELNDTLRQVKALFISYSAQYDLSDSMSNHWSDSINYWNRRADELTYRYVRSVHDILTPAQKPIYDSLVQLIMLRKRD